MVLEAAVMMRLWETSDAIKIITDSNSWNFYDLTNRYFLNSKEKLLYWPKLAFYELIIFSLHHKATLQAITFAICYVVVYAINKQWEFLCPIRMCLIINKKKKEERIVNVRKITKMPSRGESILIKLFKKIALPLKNKNIFLLNHKA